MCVGLLLETHCFDIPSGSLSMVPIGWRAGIEFEPAAAVPPNSVQAITMNDKGSC